jgi:hypothetical protein
MFPVTTYFAPASKAHSRTILATHTAAFPAITTDLDVDFPQGELIESLGFRLALDCGQGRRALDEIPEVVLNAHNHRLGFPAPVYDKPLVIFLDSLQDLSELGPGNQSGYGLGHCFGR